MGQRRQMNRQVNKIKNLRHKQFKLRKCSNCGVKLSKHEVDDICDDCISDQHINYMENEDYKNDFFNTGLD